MRHELKITPKQQRFIEASADEVLFGGAAGGGKTYAQIIDAYLYALKYAGSAQLVLRRTNPELQRSILREMPRVFAPGFYTYNKNERTCRFKNGSIIDFSYCDNESDVHRYQSAQYDVIRFDELTHFTEYMYIYLMSRNRGANDFPKSMKSTCNPGGIGHAWVKKRFIDAGPEGQVIKIAHKESANSGTFPQGDAAGSKESAGGYESTRIFIQSFVYDNHFMQKKDPGYVRRLQNLPENERKALLYGQWDIFEGQYFPEFSRELHVCEPFFVPRHWRRYIAVDYGLDMLAAYFIALDEAGRGYVYREIYSGKDNEDDGGRPLLVSEAGQVMRAAMGDEHIEAVFAPPDLWNRQRDSGESIADMWMAQGLSLIKASNERVQGWLALKEWLKPGQDEFGKPRARLQIFSTCHNLIRVLPQLCHDKKNPQDAAIIPHELTHAPDALRYFVAGRPLPALAVSEQWHEGPGIETQIEDFLNYGV